MTDLEDAGMALVELTVFRILNLCFVFSSYRTVDGLGGWLFDLSL